MTHTEKGTTAIAHAVNQRGLVEKHGQDAVSTDGDRSLSETEENWSSSEMNSRQFSVPAEGAALAASTLEGGDAGEASDAKGRKTRRGTGSKNSKPMKTVQQRQPISDLRRSLRAQGNAVMGGMTTTTLAFGEIGEKYMPPAPGAHAPLVPPGFFAPPPAPTSERWAAGQHYPPIAPIPGAYTPPYADMMAAGDDYYSEVAAVPPRGYDADVYRTAFELGRSFERRHAPPGLPLADEVPATTMTLRELRCDPSTESLMPLMEATGKQDRRELVKGAAALLKDAPSLPPGFDPSLPVKMRIRTSLVKETSWGWASAVDAVSS